MERSQSRAGQSSPAPAMPRHVAAVGGDVAKAWVLAQAVGDRPAAEVDESAFSRYTATRQDAEQIRAVQTTYQCVPEPNYSGPTLFAAFADDSIVVRDAIFYVRCQRYEAALQLQAAELAPRKAAAIDEADHVRAERQDRANAPLLAQYTEAINDPRRRKEIEPPILMTFEVDYSDANDIQRAIDTIADQILAVRRRRDAAQDRVCAVLRELAEACAVLYRGPGMLDYDGQPDLTTHREATATIKRLVGPEQAEQRWQGFMTRWRDGKAWKSR